MSNLFNDNNGNLHNAGYHNRTFSASIISTFLKNSTMMDTSKLDPKATHQSSLSIYNAFTGMKIVAPFDIFTSMDSFKVYVAQILKIDVDRLFLLTPFGIKLKFSMIVHEQINEVFVFDRKFFNPSLVKAEKSDVIIKDLLSSIVAEEQILMIKPRESPLLNTSMDVFINSIDKLVSQSTQDNNQVIINSTDLNFDKLRLLLNLMKRTSGWASALLSDMKSALFNNVYYHNYEIVENIIRALNSLIQYVSNLFTNLEKDFNNYLDIFDNLNQKSLSDKWESCFRLLEKVSFSYTDKKTKHIRTMSLSDLINVEQSVSSAKNSKLLSKKINKFFVDLRLFIESDIVKQKEIILNEYESYKVLYLKPEWETSEQTTIIQSRELYGKLENMINEMLQGTNNLPSFEELITTSNQLSTYLSQSAISKIISLKNLYKLQLEEYVPQITKLATSLYEIQHKYSDVRVELQKKIVTSTLFSVVQIQLSIREATKLLNSDIMTNIQSMQNNELQLSLIADLPLIFGIWVIAVLGNIKYGLSLKKLCRKSNEVLDMLNFIEKNNRTTWVGDFIEGFGTEKVELLCLNNETLKEKFITENLFQFHLMSDDQNTIKSTPVSKRHSSELNGYLAPFNKMLQNFNTFPLKNHSINNTNQIHEEVINDVLKNSNVPYFEGLIISITLKDIMHYLKSLELAEYDTNLLNQLKIYMKDIGINSPSMNGKNFTETGLIVKSGNLDDLGTFDSDDPHYMKIFKNFVKSFESTDITIEVKIKTEKTEKEVLDSSLVSLYEERIQKLENLLHEKKFKGFNNKWSKFSNDNFKVDDANINLVDERVIDNASGVLGRKVVNLPPSHYTEKIIQLQKENKLLQMEVDQLRRTQTGEELEKLKKEIDVHQFQLKNYQAKLEDDEKSISEKDNLIHHLYEEIEALKADNNSLSTENGKLSTDILELNIMNRDLLENMSNKENELLNENQINQKEQNNLKLRIEELLDIKNQYDKVLEKVKETEEVIGDTLSTLSFAFAKLRDLSRLASNDMETFCLILELMGMLLVDNGNKGMDIKRVKGLKYTKKNIYLKNNGIEIQPTEIDEHKDTHPDVHVDDDKLFFEIVASHMINGSREKLHWIPNIDEEITELKGMELQCKSLERDESGNTENTTEEGEKMHSSKIKEIEGTLESLNNYDAKLRSIIEMYSENDMESKYKEFIKSTLIERPLILVRIHKRFEDVETLARKLQKEKVQLKNDLKETTKKLSQRLVLHNFQKGDLALFLRTLIPVSERDTVPTNKKQPWAIFNIGSPNYYLKNKTFKDMSKLEAKEWFVGRIKNIEEYVVTKENKDSFEENPFNLTIGTKWFYVETKEATVV